MATTTAGRLLTDAHRRGQARIAAQVAERTLALWPLLDLADLDATSARWLTATRPVVASAHSESASLSDAYYRQYRVSETGIPDDLDVVTYRPLPTNQVSTSLLVTGPISIKSGSTLDTAAARMAAAAGRLALAGGRDRVGQMLETDPLVRRVRRITSPNCCAFCAMLATRDQLPPFAGSFFFEAHDNCMCQPEVSYSDSAGQTALARQFADLWQSSTNGVPSAGNGKLNAFRRALESSRR